MNSYCDDTVDNTMIPVINAHQMIEPKARTSPERFFRMMRFTMPQNTAMYGNTIANSRLINSCVLGGRRLRRSSDLS